MNLGLIKIGIHTALHGTKMFMKTHAPQILVGSGVVGFVGTVVLGCKATLKVDDILKESEEKKQKIEDYHVNGDKERYSEQDYNQDKRILKTQTFWKMVKNYAPTATLGVASIALILCGHGMLGKRAAATAAAYKALETGFVQYRERVAEAIGTEAEENIRDGLAVDKVKVKERLEKPEEELRQEQETKPVFGENCFYFSHATSSAWVDDPDSNLNTLERIRRYMEDRLICQGFLFVNDVLYELGMDQTGWGSTHGWVIDDLDNLHLKNHISFGLDFDSEDTDIRRFLKRKSPDTKLIFNCETGPINTRIDRASLGRKRALTIGKPRYSL